jgi:integrase
MASLKKRGDSYYLQFYLPGGRQKRVNLQTDSFQLAKEKLRRFESAQAAGDELPLPTRTPVQDILTAYVEHIRTVKTAKSAQTDVYYLRDVFGPICDALKITSRKVSQMAKKRPTKPGQDRRFRAAVIAADCLERITTADIATFLSSRVQSRGLAPKTANRYREILCRLINWATEQRGVKMPGGVNPALKVERYREKAPEIRFLTLAQIQRQLDVLAVKPALQAMVATYIYAGLRREELLWLTHEDVDWDAEPYGLIRVRAKTIRGEFWEPKTKVNRAVPVSGALRPYLDRQRLRSGTSTWLFASPAGSRWDPDNFSCDLRDTNRRAGLAWGCLDFRHTFGSQLAMKGESLYKIATLMGNSPEIFRRHYAALLPEALIGSVEFCRNGTEIITSGRAATADT